jgi:hypothetical protein
MPLVLLELLDDCFRADPTQRPSASAALQKISISLAASAVQEAARQQPERAREAGAELLDTITDGNTIAAMRLLQGNILPDLGVSDEVGGRHRNSRADDRLPARDLIPWWCNSFAKS